MSNSIEISILESLTSREMSVFYSLFFTFPSYKSKDRVIYKVSDLRKNLLLYFKDNNEFISVLISLNRKLSQIFSPYQFMITLHDETIQINLSKELLLFTIYYKMGNIDQKVLTPALTELKEYLNNLTVDKIKEGRSIVSLQFRWNTNTINPISF